MNNYSHLEKLLHYIILNNSTLNELLFDLEKFFFLQNEQDVSKKFPVFISGIARSGTTILLETLYNSGEFASLTYEDMPFAISPNIWSKITVFNRKKSQKVERSHKDGIYIDFKSPEAFEEIFWKNILKNKYILDKKLIFHEISNEEIKIFKNYITLICRKYKKTRYISKNNNNFLRLKDIYSKIPNSIIFIPFRDPLEHSLSLLEQHKNFEKPDNFSKKYMNWLAHHEFGFNHKPFLQSNNKETEVNLNSFTYWLSYWINNYSYLLKIIKREKLKINLINYEKICKDQKYFNKICEIAKVKKIENLFRYKKKEIPALNVSKDIIKKSYKIFEGLSEIS